MKKIISIAAIFIFTILAVVTFGQNPPHPNGGNVPGPGNTPVGGGTPLDGGTAMLIALGAAYYWRKRKAVMQ